MSFLDHFDENEQAILRARADRAAEKMLETTETLANIDTLIVTLGHETYGLPLQALSAAYQVSINLNTSIVPVPCTPPFIAGIANIRGHVVPVIDLAVLLGVPDNGSPDATGIIVITNENVTIALRVDEIGDAIRMRVRELAPVSGLFDLAKTDYVKGTLPDGTILLNIEAILKDPRLIVDKAA